MTINYKSIEWVSIYMVRWMIYIRRLIFLIYGFNFVDARFIRLVLSKAHYYLNVSYFGNRFIRRHHWAIKSFHIKTYFCSCLEHLVSETNEKANKGLISFLQNKLMSMYLVDFIILRILGIV
jgi:hypothetical protein